MAHPYAPRGKTVSLAGTVAHLQKHGKTTVEGHGSRLPSASPIKLAHEYKLDRTVGVSADIKQHQTSVRHPQTLTTEQRLQAATAHVKRERAASQARTKEIDIQIAQVRAGGGGSDQPRDYHGRWTK